MLECAEPCSRHQPLRGARAAERAVGCGLVLVALAGCYRPAPVPGGSPGTLPTISQTFDGVTTLDPQPEQITNSIGMVLRLVRPGKFVAGWPDTDHPEYGEFGGIQHEVTITRPFYIGVHEVTQRQYREVLGVSPSRHSPNSETPEFAAEFREVDTDGYPVEQVSWEEALEFCRRLSALAEEQAAGRVYTLPTEAQWEYACRAGSEGFFSTGDSIMYEHANFDTNFPWPLSADRRNPLGRPTTVGSYPANNWGLFDMHGNVQEWCLDPEREYTASPVTDPTADGTKTDLRIVRGGSFRRAAIYQRASLRNELPKASRSYDVGFRVIIQQ